MQVKKFEAPTIAEALKLVKSELGPEAIILSTKNHRKGFGLLSKASVEITAAVADKSLAKKQITERLVPQNTKDQISKLSASKQAEIFDDFDGYVGRKRGERQVKADARDAAPQQQVRRPAPQPTRQAPAPAPYGQQQQTLTAREQYKIPANRTSGPPRYIDIADEDEPVQQAKGYGRNGKVPTPQTELHADSQSAHMARQMARPAQQPASQPQQQREESQNTESVAALQDDIERLKTMLEEIKSEQTALSDARIPETTSDEMQVEFQNLLRNGIDKRYAVALIKQVSFSVPRESLKNSDALVEAVAVEMMDGLKIDHPLELKSGHERRVFAFIGPTGVGKTTTIAKLASQAILQKNLRVGLINIDSYKVAALDQLATYAKILNVPFRSATNAMELDRALQEFKPLDLVLIDTTGRSQRDSESLIQMKTLLSENAAVRPLLIMSATTRDQELYDIVTRFKIFNPTGLIFSKLDETSTFGCIYNVSMKTGIPLTYFTVGQRVPEDIEPASRERVADLILDL